jgi:hypothetical protein
VLTQDGADSSAFTWRACWPPLRSPDRLAAASVAELAAIRAWARDRQSVARFFADEATAGCFTARRGRGEHGRAEDGLARSRLAGKSFVLTGR